MRRIGSPGLSALLLVAGAASCSASAEPGGFAVPTPVAGDLSDVPLRSSFKEERDRFDDGDAVFERIFRPADGLGPLFIRTSCASCHRAAAKGPGGVEKMSIVERDGVTASRDQSRLPFGHTVRPYLAAGATTPIEPPPARDGVKVSLRVGPPVFGRGYMEAVADSEIERVAAEQAKRTDAIHGRVHRVTFASEANPKQRFHAHTKGERGLIGRFGVKARIATIDEFAADAFQGDMGITSPMRPVELPNPDGLTDDLKPGIDVELGEVNAVADYMRLLEIPQRATPSERGRALFDRALCSACHAPSMRTRADYPIAPLAGIDAAVFTDFLLHDMGAALADGLEDGDARSREWRTAPLIGLRFNRGFLHDGRAPSLEEAILLHGVPGSEAEGSARLFRSLTADDRAELLRFVGGL